jgi:hypothetical protein
MAQELEGLGPGELMFSVTQINKQIYRNEIEMGCARRTGALPKNEPGRVADFLCG